MSLFSRATAAMFSFVGGGRSCEKKEEEEEIEKKNDDDNDNDEYYDCCLLSATIDKNGSEEFAPAVAPEVSVTTSSSFSSSRRSDNEEEEEEFDPDVPITKKKKRSLKSTGFDYCGRPSGDDGDDGGDDPHLEFFRKVLDSSKNGTTAPATAVPCNAPAPASTTIMSPSEERERVLHISMKIIEKEFQLLNRKAQYFQQNYLLQQQEEISKNQNKQLKDDEIEIKKKKDDDDGPNNATATATTTTTTTKISNCQGREDILHVSFQLIQKQIQLLKERAQFFNSILLQEYTYKQTFQKEIEDTIITGMNE
ncbi:hypothetical protein FRACYDRAFT_246115 [Fragilariopsis cylindrus CCMP1102]|uniref:Uncharacterized protein n=1 Tax=Fragilariopsis cylindrus CCMP1102 TaxID=635003 RepID=A0A1E7EZP2_9STRA|nr:hypothetical protein FRACYDRAFT_246115 [Fragilariopsis cylindrus CCMP1102]|eukprot:OEU11013.1 hypothetical protein FRACYDRAFT_246115 [Fragilariopsis cylindrus CCMP1102]